MSTKQKQLRQFRAKKRLEAHLAITDDKEFVKNAKRFKNREFESIDADELKKYRKSVENQLAKLPLFREMEEEHNE